MRDRRILLFGANGQVGHELRRTLAAFGQLTALDFPEVNFADPASLSALVRQVQPHVVVNAAAHTAVDRAETEIDQAFATNAEAPAVLAREAQALDAVLVHYSTDYVFDGTKAAPWVETDMPNPLSVYGRSKLGGEVAVQSCARHLTFRTSWVVGAHGHNFIKTVLKLARDRDTLKVVADQFGAPTSAALLAGMTAVALAAMEGAPVDDPRWGLYHLVAAGETTWHGLAREVIAGARGRGETLRATPEAVQPITTADYPTPAARPRNSRLDTTKFRAVFNVSLPDWKAGVHDVLDRILMAENA